MIRDLNAMGPAEALRAVAAHPLMRRLVELAHNEDLGHTGDVTSAACIEPGRRGRGRIVARSEMVVCGVGLIELVIGVFGAEVRCRPIAADGDRVAPGASLAEIEGALADLLAVERTVLNLIGRLSGVATQTARYVSAIPQGVRARVFDTRKTTPGLRLAEKAAVRAGGGWCHRMGLHDAVLIKDNHLWGMGMQSGSRVGTLVSHAAARARAAGAMRGQPPAFVEVEVDELEQLAAVLALPPGTVDLVLLDNMPAEMLGRAVEMRDAAGSGAKLEASGGVRLETIGEIARTGVERISVGALTHSAVCSDVALDVDAGSEQERSGSRTGAVGA